MKNKIEKKLTAELKKAGTIMALSERLNIPYGSLWRMLKGGGSLKNWEKAEAFFYNKVS